MLKLAFILFVGLALVIAIGTLRTTPSSADNPTKPAATKRDDFDADVMRAAVALAWLRSNARNPDSFVLESAALMPDRSACYTFRSQNGFGGMNREWAVLTPKDVVRIVTQEGEGDRAAWNRHCAKKTGRQLPTDYMMTLARFAGAR